MRMRFISIFLAAVLACSAVSAQSTELKIRDEEKEVWLTEQQFFDELAKVRAIVIGERHGAPAHHGFQADLIYELAERGVYPTLALEVFDPSHKPLIERYRRESPEYVDGLGADLRWWETGWPSFSNYVALLQSAFALKLGIEAADIDADAETTDIKDAEQDDLNFWMERTREDHCDLLEPDILKAKALRQVTRDLNFKQVTARGRTLLIVGRNHLMTFADTDVTTVSLGGTDIPARYRVILPEPDRNDLCSRLRK